MGATPPAIRRTEAGTPLLALPPGGMMPNVVSTSMPARERHRATFPLRNPPIYPNGIGKGESECGAARHRATGVSL